MSAIYWETVPPSLIHLPKHFFQGEFRLCQYLLRDYGCWKDSAVTDLEHLEPRMWDSFFVHIADAHLSTATFPSACLSVCLFVCQSPAVNDSFESLSTLVDPNRRWSNPINGSTTVIDNLIMPCTQEITVFCLSLISATAKRTKMIYKLTERLWPLVYPKYHDRFRSTVDQQSNRFSTNMKFLSYIMNCFLCFSRMQQSKEWRISIHRFRWCWSRSQ